MPRDWRRSPLRRVDRRSRSRRRGRRQSRRGHAIRRPNGWAAPVTFATACEEASDRAACDNVEHAGRRRPGALGAVVIGTCLGGGHRRLPFVILAIGIPIALACDCCCGSEGCSDACGSRCGGQVPRRPADAPTRDPFCQTLGGDLWMSDRSTIESSFAVSKRVSRTAAESLSRTPRKRSRNEAR